MTKGGTLFLLQILQFNIVKNWRSRTLWRLSVTKVIMLHRMRPISTDVAWSVYRSVCWSQP